MNSGLIVCELCKREYPDKEPFKSGYDEIGIALMRAHLDDKHPNIKRKRG